ncbi:hypothetical protein [Nocardia gipuzkoensis]|uniref:hypothetical protein n=1 Tax=Nocardia gipuzkoensis TaxID=2749991 RepID=UPI00237D6889|nr:hypothetical protein [Nocardia gipuzkoensis]MDE1675326.1 hypothetical protein [Nocardia gipuzkoensis]
MVSQVIVSEVTEQMISLDIIDPVAVTCAMDTRLWAAGDLERSLVYFGEPDSVAVLRLIEHLGVRYALDDWTFRGIGKGYFTMKGIETLYREELEDIAACTRGRVAIADVQWVDDGQGGHLLEFRCNGEPVRWPIINDKLKASLTFATLFSYLEPHRGLAGWCRSTPADEGVSAVFGVPGALDQLGERFGLTSER